MNGCGAGSSKTRSTRVACSGSWPPSSWAAGPLPAAAWRWRSAGLAAFLVLVRLVSMAWAALRLHGFRLTRIGDDLRVTYGFFTRVAATIPASACPGRDRAARLARSPAGTRVDPGRDRGWTSRCGREGPRMGGADRQGARCRRAAGGSASWRDPAGGRLAAGAPRAFRRAVKPVLLLASIASTALALTFGWRLVVVASPLLAWLMVSTRQHVRHLAWLASESLVAFRSGWLSQAETIVRVNRVQSVTLRESPFDRRARHGRCSCRHCRCGGAVASRRHSVSRGCGWRAACSSGWLAPPREPTSSGRKPPIITTWNSTVTARPVKVCRHVACSG